MQRRPIQIGLAAIVVIAAAVVTVLALGDRDPSASPSPSPSASTPSASVEASASPSASEAPTESASPSQAAGPFEIAWEPVELEPDADVNGVSFVGGRWFVVGQVFPEAAIWTSDDGRSWSRAEIASTRDENEVTAVTDIVELDGQLVAIGAFGLMESDQFAWMTWTSDDAGATWTERRGGPSPHALRAIVPAGDGLVAAGSDYAGTTPFDSWIAVSEDGLTWERTPATFPDSEIHSLAVREDRIVAVGNSYVDGDFDARAWYSDDGGEAWTLVEIPDGGAPETLYEVVATDDGFVAIGDGVSGEGDSGAAAWVSADGASWERVAVADAADGRALAPVEGGLVAVGNIVGQDVGPGLSWTSVEGRTWESGPDLNDGSVVLIAADGDGSVVVAGGQCLGSCDAVLWIGEVTR